MNRGAYEKAVHIKETGSPYFAEAIFILKTGLEVDPTDMAKEAQRLVDSYAAKYCRKAKRAGRARFVYPICIAMAAIALAVFIISRL